MCVLRDVGVGVGLVALAAVLTMGCGVSEVVEPPEAGYAFLDVPDSADVWLDGLHLGEGPREILWFINYPNYLRVEDWRLIVWSAGGLDTLSLVGESKPVDMVSPARVRLSE